MKFNLPKSLMVTILATMATAPSYATSWMDTIDEIVNVKKSETIQWNSDNAPENKVAHAIAKDGEGTISITGNVDKYSTVYVREGEVLVGDGETTTNLKLHTTATAKDAEDSFQRYTSLGVAGKDAVMTFNKGNYTSSTESAHFVGSIDGNGTMNITNKSVVDLASGNVFVIGDFSVEEATDKNGEVDQWSNATTQNVGDAPNGANRYIGNYITREVAGETYTFGHGVVNVDGGSYFRAAYGNFWIGDGELNVSGEGTKADLALSGYGFGLKLGLGEGSTASISVKDGATVTSYVNTGYICYGDDSTSLITLDNGATFNIYSQNYQNNTPTISFGYHAMGGKAIVELTNNSFMNLISTEGVNRMKTVLSWDDNSGDSTASISIDKSSGFSADIVESYKGTVIDNSGKFAANDMNVHGGTITNNSTGTLQVNGTLTIKGGELINSGKLLGNAEGISMTTDSEDLLVITASGSVENSGTIEKAIIMNGGELTALDGSTMASLSATGGLIEVQGNVIMTGALTLNGAMLAFADGSTIDMQGNTVTISNLASIIVNDADGKFTLFTNVNEESISALNGTTFTYISNGVEKTGTLTTGADGKSLAVVPEPTTATLSLLALAALAARRRRR